jgi:hypothetical protein
MQQQYRNYNVTFIAAESPARGKKRKHEGDEGD